MVGPSGMHSATTTIIVAATANKVAILDSKNSTIR